MKMASDQRRLDVRAMQLAPNEPRCRTRPDRVFDVHDRRHQGDETKIGFNQREQRADPSAVTGGEHAELAAASFPESLHQLSQFDHALTQPFCVANQIARDRKFAVPITARDTRKVIWQMNKTCIPAKLVEATSAAAIADATG